MSTMNSEVYAALIEMKASLLLLKWMVGFNLAFSAAILWRILALD